MMPSKKIKLATFTDLRTLLNIQGKRIFSLPATSGSMIISNLSIVKSQIRQPKCNKCIHQKYKNNRFYIVQNTPVTLNHDMTQKNCQHINLLER